MTFRQLKEIEGGWSIITLHRQNKDERTAYINLPARWKASRRSTHWWGPTSATLITLMTGKINVLPLSTIFYVSLGSFRVQTYYVNMPAAVPAFIILSATYLRAAADEWEAVFIVAVSGNLALMTRRQKWPLLRLKWPWIISHYLSFSPKAIELLGRIKRWQQGETMLFHKLRCILALRHFLFTQLRFLSVDNLKLSTGRVSLPLVPVITGVWELRDHTDRASWPRKIMTPKTDWFWSLCFFFWLDRRSGQALQMCLLLSEWVSEWVSEWGDQISGLVRQ